MNEVNLVEQTDEKLFLKIIPIKYNDNRNPRLPRKSSKQTKLQIDTNYLFQFAFKPVLSILNDKDKFSVKIKVFKSNDRLGGGDLDNYCKAILDAITFTKKVWVDDKQVDEIHIKRTISGCFYSFIELIIAKI